MTALRIWSGSHSATSWDAIQVAGDSWDGARTRDIQLALPAIRDKVSRFSHVDNTVPLGVQTILRADSPGSRNAVHCRAGDFHDERLPDQCSRGSHTCASSLPLRRSWTAKLSRNTWASRRRMHTLRRSRRQIWALPSVVIGLPFEFVNRRSPFLPSPSRRTSRYRPTDRSASFSATITLPFSPFPITLISPVRNSRRRGKALLAHLCACRCHKGTPPRLLFFGHLDCQRSIR